MGTDGKDGGHGFLFSIFARVAALAAPHSEGPAQKGKEPEAILTTKTNQNW
jgi:hypothetical protein